MCALSLYKKEDKFREKEEVSVALCKETQRVREKVFQVEMNVSLLMASFVQVFFSSSSSSFFFFNFLLNCKCVCVCVYMNVPVCSNNFLAAGIVKIQATSVL